MEPTLEDLARTIHAHPWKSDCPECGENCSRVALTELAYTFEPCTCDIEPRFAHLVEQVHHKECLVEYGFDEDDGPDEGDRFNIDK